MKAIDLEFKDCRLKVDHDWGKYSDKNMDVLSVLDLVKRFYTPTNARDLTFENAILATGYPLGKKRLHRVIEILMEKNALLDK